MRKKLRLQTDTRLVVSVLVGVIIAGVTPASSASAAVNLGDALIQPGGAYILESGHGLNELCTLGFILKRTSGTSAQLAKRYTTVASECAGSVGSRAKAPDIGYFGTFVTKGSPPGGIPRVGLIEVDSDKLNRVSPVVKGYGAAPSGIATQAQIATGDVVATYGYPMGTPATADKSVVRYGVVWNVFRGEPDYSYFHIASQEPAIWDLGAPVVHKGNALAYGLQDDYFFPGLANPLHSLLPQIATASGFSLTLAR